MVPAEVALGPDVAIEAQRAIDVTLQRCARDAACAQQFPDVSAQFAALQAKLSAEPVKLSIPHPLSGAVVETTLDGARLGAAVRLLSYADETVSTLPLLIHEAQTLREPQALAAQYLRVESDLEEQIAAGMHFAVVCSEDAPRWDQESFRKNSSRRLIWARVHARHARSLRRLAARARWIRTSAHRSKAACRR